MMRYVYVITISLLLASCGPSSEDKNIAAVTCSIMAETKNMDRAIRVEKLNDAREKIGGEPFLKGDDAIKEAFEYGLCEELILNENYNEALQPLKEIERIAAERREEEDRLEAERQKIADSKPTVKEIFYSNGKLKNRTNYQSVNDGGKKHGLEENYYENGQLRIKDNYKDGELHGLRESYYHNGQLYSKENYKDGKQDGLEENYYENGQLRIKDNYKDGELHGLKEYYYENGKLFFRGSYKDGKQDGLYELFDEDGHLTLVKCYKRNYETDMSYCKQQ